MDCKIGWRYFSVAFTILSGKDLFTSTQGKTIYINTNDTSITIPCSVSHPDVRVLLHQVGEFFVTTSKWRNVAACSRPLQVLTETSELSFVTKKSELDKLCPDLHAGLQCIRSYTRRCMNEHQRTHFNKLYHGTGEMIHELCEDEAYQEDFLRHAPCMRHVKTQFEQCSKRYQNTMTQISQTTPDEHEIRQQQYQQQQQQYYQQQSQQQYQQQHSQTQFNNTRSEDDGAEGIKAVCCAFKEYMACSEHTVKRVCGREAAFFTRNFLDKISNSLMRMHCENYHSEPGECGEPSASQRNIFSTLCSVYLALFVIALQRFYV